MKDQYSNMFGALRLCSRSDEAQVISNSSRHTNPHPAATGCPLRYTAPNAMSPANVAASRVKKACGSTGVPRLRMLRANTS